MFICISVYPSHFLLAGQLGITTRVLLYYSTGVPLQMPLFVVDYLQYGDAII